MHQILCLPVYVNCGLDCLTFRCFAVWTEECSFLTSLSVKALCGRELTETGSLVWDLSFWHLFRNLLSCLSRGQKQFKVSERPRGRNKSAGTYRIHWIHFSVLDLLHSAHANSALTNTSSQYHTHLKLWDQLISIHIIIARLCVCFRRADLYELEKEPSYWDAQARMTLDAALKLRPRDHRAKNIILFLGDGRSCCPLETLAVVS